MVPPLGGHDTERDRENKQYKGGGSPVKPWEPWDWHPLYKTQAHEVWAHDVEHVGPKVVVEDHHQLVQEHSIAPDETGLRAGRVAEPLVRRS